MGLIRLLKDLNTFYQDNPFSQQFNGGSSNATPPVAVAQGSFDQKSIKYGKDRFGGGSSNQPYITTPIPEDYQGNTADFILRGGILNPKYVLQDVSRITQLLTDTKSPQGLLFIAKQELLERQNVIAPGAPERIYNPLGTIAQVGVNGIGYHLNKQGLNPFTTGYFNGGKAGYFYFTKDRNDINEQVIGGENRLVLLYNTKQIETPANIDISTGNILYNISNNSELLFSYNGGPNSVGGLGKTNIRITSDRTNLINDKIKNNPKHIIGTNPNWIYNPSYGTGVSIQYTADLNLDEAKVYETLYTADAKNLLNNLNKTGINIFPEPQLKQGKSTLLSNLNPVYTITHRNSDGNIVDVPNPYPNIETFNREYTYGTMHTIYYNSRTRISNDSLVTDELNETKILSNYDDKNLIEDLKNKDLVKFFFEINNNNAETNTQNWFLFFRAYINNFGDNFKSELQSYKYVGRAENFYKYGGFSRDISLSFTIYAHSRAEMLPIYQKLNYLVGTTAPDYSNFGLMRGNFINLTVGDYINNVPGLINNISLKPSFEAGWDINRKDDGSPFDSDIDANEDGTGFVGQLPRMIDVDISFIPIHSFTPKFGENFLRNI